MKLVPAEPWVKFRGLARLPETRIDRSLIPSVWISLTVRHGPRLLDFLRRLFL